MKLPFANSNALDTNPPSHLNDQVEHSNIYYSDSSNKWPVFIAYALSITAIAANAQHDPHSP